MPKIKRALISVTDKTGIADFAKFLDSQNIEILSTGGTAKVIREAGINVRDVSDYTGSPEILDGRLKTIHPKVEGGLLGIRSNEKHLQEMKDNGIEDIDLLVVNLYEFEKTVAREGVTLEEAIENIDIGGPTMIRAAAKNHQDVTVVVDPGDYQCIQEEMQNKAGEVSSETNFRLAVKVFQSMAAYDGAISNYLSEQITSAGSTERLSLQFKKVQDLRYGENPHQKAALYQDLSSSTSLIQAQQLHGKELSFNNWIDLEGAYNACREFQNKPACVIVKHTNPCGVALAESQKEAFLRAKEADPVSCFGGIIAFNKKVELDTAQLVGETFFECIIAPDYDPSALEVLQSKKNIRLMKYPDFFQTVKSDKDLKRVGGGLLVQDKDLGVIDIRSCQVPTKRKPTEEEYQELDFAWRVVKHVKSNAIVFTKNLQTCGIGAGQMSRVDSTKIAVMKSQIDLSGSVLASDAFFPFRDGPDAAAKAGVTAIIQPGGSVRDKEVIQAADEQGLCMVFTGMRHFRH